jgi:hypothetical protein
MYIKRLLEEGGLVQTVSIARERRVKAIELFADEGNKKHRFCNEASTHTLRSTAITTMLCLGTPEWIVRKISGHVPSSKDFFR